MRRLKIVSYGTAKGNKKVDFNGATRYRMDDNQSHYILAIDAIRVALERGGFTVDDMDIIVFASAVGYQPIPCSAALVSEKLRPTRPIPCMDINTSCTSFVSALDTMSYLIEAGRYKRVLIITAEVASIGLNENQKESFELFSDAAACMIIEQTDDKETGVLYGLQRTWVEGAHDTEIRGGLTSLNARHYNEETKAEYLFDMKGGQVLQLTAKKMPEFIREFEDQSGYKITDMDMIIPHQASRALPMVMRRIGIPKDKYINLVNDYGNMIAASIPYMLCYALDKKLVKKGDRVLLFGTAAGLTISGLVLRV